MPRESGRTPDANKQFYFGTPPRGQEGARTSPYEEMVCLDMRNSDALRDNLSAPDLVGLWSGLRYNAIAATNNIPRSFQDD